MHITKPVIRMKAEVLTLLVTLLFVALYNEKIWSIYSTAHDFSTLGDFAEGLSFTAFLFLLLFTAFNLFSLKGIQKTAFAAVMLMSSGAMYFSNQLNVYFDTTMIQNLFETDYREASELLVWPLFKSVLLYGVLPVLLMMKIRPVYRPWLRQSGQNVVLSFVSLLLAIVVALPFYASHSSFIRNNNIALRESLLPVSYINSTTSYLKSQLKSQHKPRTPIDENPSKSADWQYYSKPLALVFIVGETARADSFSLQHGDNSEFLGGNDNLFYYKDFSSCGTSTVVSVPCMFSVFSKDNFSRSMRLEYENVMDVINRSGFNTYWLDNHNGCKGVCEGIGIQNLTQELSYEFFNEDQFYDEALVDGLGQRIAKTAGNQVRVLHQLGSHGPSYYKRLPEKFLVSQPACLSDDLSKCDNQAITNTYKDTVRYTEYVISKAISELNSIKDTHDTVLVYVSDHGESTGENGLYLHGVPMFLAPQEQTHVPALLWLSEPFMASRQIDQNCLHASTNQPYSHDNVSHTLIGLLDIDSQVYQPDLDLVEGCRS